MSRQSEEALEEQLLKQLQKIGYASVTIPDEKTLVPNLKSQLEKHNKTEFSPTEFDKVLEFKDESKDIHHKLYVKDNKLVGVVLTGDLKEQNNLKKAVFNHDNVEEYLKTGLKFK